MNEQSIINELMSLINELIIFVFSPKTGYNYQKLSEIVGIIAYR